MDKNLKKQYKENYKQEKNEMGIVAVTNLTDGRIYMEASLNCRAWLNKAQFTLKIGKFDNAALQQDWSALGETQFKFEIVAELKEKEDDPFVDYKKDIKKLEEKVREELLQENKVLY